MKKTFLQKLALVFSGSIVLVYGTMWACGGGDWDFNYREETNFTPEALADQKYAPYFLSQDLFYDNSFLENTGNLFDEDVVKDWSEFLNGKLKEETISFFIADTGNVAVNDLYNYISKRKETTLVKNWSKKIDLKDKKTKDFIEFLHYAKPIQVASVSGNRWDYEETDKVRFQDLKWIQSIEGKYNATSDKFLKNRYWFQVMKAYFYSDKPENGITFFEKTNELQPKNILYYRAVSYLAGINSRLGNTAKANYLYSQVFDKSPKMQQIAVYCFSPKEQKDFDESFSFAKNKDEKIALWAIHGYYNDEEKAIENIFNLNPKSDYLDFLLTRLVNSEELKTKKSFEKQTVIENKKFNSDTISNSAVNLIDKIAQSKSTNKPYLWNAAAGYLQTLNRNFARADDYFAKAEKEIPKTELAINQVRLLKFINNLSKIDKLTSKNEATIIADLNWLYVELPQKSDANFRYSNASNWSRNYISALYRSQDNKVMEEVFLRNPEFYHDNTNLLAMKSFLMKKDKTPLQEIGSKIYDVKLQDISEYQAVLATFQNKIPEAIAFMNETDGIKESVFMANPFNGNIKDCHDCDFVAYQKRKYSQLEFLNTIKEMQDKIGKNEDVYTNAMLLGNAFYNITHFGNARMFYEGTIIGYGTTEFDFDDIIRKLITDCSLAQKYYKMAFSASKNNEQKAKMTYMISKCERNDFYNNRNSQFENYWQVDNKEIDFIVWNGFKTLKKDYSKTKFYQEVISECGYFSTYLYGYKKE